MNTVKAPQSLRSALGHKLVQVKSEIEPARTVSLACLMAAGSVGAAEAQAPVSALPPVMIDPPVARQRPAAARPTRAATVARTAVRRKTRQVQRVAAALP